MAPVSERKKGSVAGALGRRPCQWARTFKTARRVFDRRSPPASQKPELAQGLDAVRVDLKRVFEVALRPVGAVVRLLDVAEEQVRLIVERVELDGAVELEAGALDGGRIARRQVPGAPAEPGVEDALVAAQLDRLLKELAGLGVVFLAEERFAELELALGGQRL